MNNAVPSPLLLAAVGPVVVFVAAGLVEVMLNEVEELVGSTVVELDTVLLPTVVLGLGLEVVLVLVLRLGILDDITAVVGASLLLTPTKRAAVARSRHNQRHSNALTRGDLDSTMAAYYPLFSEHRARRVRRLYDRAKVMLADR